MNTPKLFSRRFLVLLLAAMLLLTMAFPAFATDGKAPYKEIGASHEDAEFTYELFLTDKNGMSITNPRKLAAGDTINVEIRLTREKFNSPSYDSYGIEFRLMTRGLTYNYDGVTLRGDTDVREQHYDDGKVVGFAWYDMQQIGDSISNPVLASSWSYTVDDPNMVNIMVPVALIYITGDSEKYIPVGNATIYLDPEGAKFVGEDISGTYPSGTVVILPALEMGDWVFVGWTDGAHIYPAGSEYTVTGIVTLTPVWKELVRNRHLQLDPKGGELLGEDITGYYADGQMVILPDVQREGYNFLGWTDGVATYPAGAEYTVYNTVIISALWEPVDAGNHGNGEGGLNWLWLLLLLPFIWLILLWKRSFVKYSLVNGDVSLNYKNGDRAVQVEVVLIDDDDQKRSLIKSGIVEPKERLRYIKNVMQLPIVQVEPGKYKGKLMITRGRVSEVRKCRIKVLDKELKEKK